jgi:hypothetical protein
LNPENTAFLFVCVCTLVCVRFTYSFNACALWVGGGGGTGRSSQQEVEAIREKWRAGQYRLSPAKNEQPNLMQCVPKASRLLQASKRKGDAPAASHDDL